MTHKELFEALLEGKSVSYIGVQGRRTIINLKSLDERPSIYHIDTSYFNYQIYEEPKYQALILIDNQTYETTSQTYFTAEEAAEDIFDRNFNNKFIKLLKPEEI